jgi:hypothetical protein
VTVPQQLMSRNVDGPDVAVGAVANTVTGCDRRLRPSLRNLPFLVKLHYRMFSTVEDLSVVIFIDVDARCFAEVPALG